jgi:mannosyltransferase
MATQLRAREYLRDEEGRRRALFTWGLLLLVVAGLVLRVLAARPGFLGDELFTYAIAERDSLGGLMDGVRDTENTPPLYYVLAWATLKVTQVPELIRLPSMVAGTAMIAVAGLLGRRVYGARAGLAAAAVFAVSPFAVYYASEARSYTPAAFAVLLSTLLLLRALECRGRAEWAGFAVCVAAAVWFHYTAVFPLAAQALWALTAHPAARRQVVAAHLGAVLLYAPWLPFAGAYVPVALIGALSPFSPEQLVEFPARVLVGHPIGELDRAPGTAAAVALGLLLASALVLGARRAKGRRLRLADPTLLLVAMALAAPLGVLAYSALKSNIFLPRNLIVSQPAAIVLIGGLLGRLKPWPALAATAVVVVLLAPSAISTAVGSLARPPYDEVARLIDARGGEHDPVIEGPLFPVEKTLSAPLRQPLVDFLTRQRPIYFSDEPEPGWRAARRAGRGFAVYPDVYSGFSEYLRPVPPPGSGLVAVDRRVYSSTPRLIYVEYERRP